MTQVPFGQIAPISRRAIAYLIDALIAGGIGVVLTLVLVVAANLSGSLEGSVATLVIGGPIVSLVLLGWFVFYTFMQAGAGSIGMRTQGLRLISEDGTPLGFGRTLLRNVIFGLAAGIVVGYFTPLFDGSGRFQGWHDKVAKSLMLDARGEGASHAPRPSDARAAGAPQAAPPVPQGAPPVPQGAPLAQGVPAASQGVPAIPGIPVPPSVPAAPGIPVPQSGAPAPSFARPDVAPAAPFGAPPAPGFAAPAAPEYAAPAAPEYAAPAAPEYPAAPQPAAPVLSDAPAASGAPAASAPAEAPAYTSPAAQPADDGGLIAYVPGITVDAPPPRTAAQGASSQQVTPERPAAPAFATPEPAPAFPAAPAFAAPVAPAAPPAPAAPTAGIAASADAPEEDDLEETRISIPGHRLVFTWDDGTRVTVSRRTVFGRNPGPEDGAILVPVRDETLSLSKTHFEAAASTSGGWILDRYSTNGMTIVRDGQRIACPAGQRVPVRLGDAIEIGDRIVTIGGYA